MIYLIISYTQERKDCLGGKNRDNRKIQFITFMNFIPNQKLLCRIEELNVCV